MALHEDKFEYICHLANRRNPLHQLPFAHEHFQYTTSTGTILIPVDQLRDLGIAGSSDLSWTSHIQSSCDKARAEDDGSLGFQRRPHSQYWGHVNTIQVTSP